MEVRMILQFSRKAACLSVGILLLLGHAAFADPLTIRFGTANFPSNMAPAIFQAPAGVLKHYGKTYTIRLEKGAASSAQTTAMAAGDIDVGMFSPAAFSLAVTNAGLDMRVIGDGVQDGVGDYRSQTLYVKAGSSIKTVQDLRGKVVGVNGIGSAGYTAIVGMLRKNGLNETRDVKFLEVSFANQFPMEEDGKIDASTFDDAQGAELVQAGKYRALFSSGQALGPTQFNFIASTSQFLEKHHAEMMDMMEDYTRAMKWYMDPANRQPALKIISDIAKRPESSLYYLFTKLDYYRDPDTTPNIKGIQTTIDFSREIGFLKQRIDISPKYVDLSFLEEAKRRIAANP
jgi:ABC-type nitrate/sulfonate/bicarbonate transport system substrate-binding protein